MAHTGPVQIRWHDKPHPWVSVLCPLGHSVTAADTRPAAGFAGGALAAKIGAHQNGGDRWIVTCDGTATSQGDH